MTMRKIITMTTIAALTATILTGCNNSTADANETEYEQVVLTMPEATAPVEEVAEVVEDEPEVVTEEVAEEIPHAECPGAPEYVPSEPEMANTGCVGRYIVKEPKAVLSFVAYVGDSEKFEEVRGLVSGEYVQVIGQTTKGWYALADGSYIHSYTVEYSPEQKQQTAQTKTPTTTTTTNAPATESQPAEDSQPQQEQTYEEPAQQTAEQPVEETPAVVTEEHEDVPYVDTDKEAELWALFEAQQEASANCSHTSTHQELHSSMGEEFWVTVCDECGGVW